MMGTLKYQLDFRSKMSGFDFPSVECVCLKLDSILTDQEFVVQPLRNHLKGIYNIYPEKAVDLSALPPIHFQARKRFSDEIEQIPIHVTDIPARLPRRTNLSVDEGEGAARPSKPPREGTLVTIVGSALTLELKKIPNAAFDTVFRNLGFEVVKLTVFQNHRGTSHANGNRYLVVKADGKKIPNNIQIIDPNFEREQFFSTRYRGQTWRCRRCNVDHVGACPVMQEFYAARDERSKHQIETKIFSDSSLRHGDCTGLKADILCVSGGTFGELLNAVLDDPATPNLKDVIILGGINDLIDNDCTTPRNKDFAFVVNTVTRKLDRLLQFFTSLSITLMPPLMPPDRTYTIEARRLCLEMELYGASSHPRISYYDPLLIDIPFQDDNVHPTPEGTTTVLKTLNEHKPGLVLNEKFLATPNFYAGTETTTRWGCRSCWEPGEYEGRLCADCREDTRNHVDMDNMNKAWDQIYAENPDLRVDDPPLLEGEGDDEFIHAMITRDVDCVLYSIVTHVENDLLPSATNIVDDIDMINANKRSRSSSTDEETQIQKKLPPDPTNEMDPAGRRYIDALFGDEPDDIEATGFDSFVQNANTNFDNESMVVEDGVSEGEVVSTPNDSHSESEFSF